MTADALSREDDAPGPGSVLADSRGEAASSGRGVESIGVEFDAAKEREHVFQRRADDAPILEPAGTRARFEAMLRIEGDVAQHGSGLREDVAEPLREIRAGKLAVRQAEGSGERAEIGKAEAITRTGTGQATDEVVLRGTDRQLKDRKPNGTDESK